MSGGTVSKTLDRFPTVRMFLDWWFGELAGLLPGALKRRAGPGGDALVVSMSEAGAEVMLRRGGTVRRLGSVAAGEGDEGRAAFDALTRGLRLDRSATVLRLPAARLLRTTRAFPLAAEADLRRIVGNQIDRWTPYAAGQVHFDCRVVGRDPWEKKLTAEIVTLPRSVSDGPMAWLARRGIRPGFIEAGGAEGGAQAIEVRDESGEPPPRRSRLSLNATLAAVNVVLVVIAVGWPLVERARVERDLRERVDIAQIRATAAAKMRAEVDRARAEASYLATKKVEAPRAIAVLDEVTRVLPDGTWLEHFSLDGRALQVRGVSARAASLIGDMEASALIDGVRFRAPVTRQPATGREQFHIAAELAPGGGR